MHARPTRRPREGEGGKAQLRWKSAQKKNSRLSFITKAKLISCQVEILPKNFKKKLNIITYVRLY